MSADLSPYVNLTSDMIEDWARAVLAEIDREPLIPADVPDFRAVHDYVDANTLVEDVIALTFDASDRDDYPDTYTAAVERNAVNAVEAYVDAWLKARIRPAGIAYRTIPAVYVNPTTGRETTRVWAFTTEDRPRRGVCVRCGEPVIRNGYGNPRGGYKAAGEPADGRIGLRCADLRHHHVGQAESK